MIYVINKRRFDEFINEQGINDDNVEEFDHWAFISILNYKFWPEAEYYQKSIFDKNHSNVLVLTFDDIMNEKGGYKAFDYDQAQQIIDFANKNRNKTYYIHCAAGISRSGAVGTFLCDYLQHDFNQFKQLNRKIQPNGRVSQMLNDMMWKHKWQKQKLKK